MMRSRGTGSGFILPILRRPRIASRTLIRAPWDSVEPPSVMAGSSSSGCPGVEHRGPLSQYAGELRDYSPTRQSRSFRGRSVEKGVPAPGNAEGRVPGAGDGIRTHNLLRGTETLYH